VVRADERTDPPCQRNDRVTAGAEPARAAAPAVGRAPRWYEDAVIYELHVRAFADSNGDGVGDFRGLLTKLDHVRDLGADTIWLLPFYPSPLRDDGYDIADYDRVHPDYGDLRSFQRFLAAAHARHIRVITELSSTTRRTSTRGSSAPAGRPRVRRSATSTSGATPTPGMPARGSSFWIPRNRTGRSTRSPASISGTASSRTSPT
jgi:hypothetical protein